MSEAVRVVYLVWTPLGTEPVRRFAEAWRAHPPGTATRLIVLFNGPAANDDDFCVALGGLPYEPLAVPWPVMDLAAYFWAARQLGPGPVCFLNTHSEPRVDGWLERMVRHLEGRVQLVGCTGCWESPYTSMLAGRPLFRPSPLLPAPAARAREWWALTRYRWWYPPFPNPHVRTNAFLVRAEQLATVRRGSLRKKLDCLRLEAGWDSLTRQVRRSGGRVVLAGADGRAYPPRRWRESGVYRCDGQPNLLVADNRTRDYESADPERRRQLRRLAWGNDG